MTRSRLVPLAALALIVRLFAWASPVAADTPVTVDDVFVVQKDSTPNSLDVLGNDTVIAPAEISDVTDPAHGSVTITQSGLRVGYTPDPGYTGPDAFDYTVTDPVDGAATATVTIKVNAPPVAVADPTAGCDVGTSLAYGAIEDTAFENGAPCNLIGNDTDPDGTVTSWQIVVPPAHGQVTNVLPGPLPGLSPDMRYVPDADYFTPPGDVTGGTWASDAFTYRAVDEDGGLSDPVTVTVWVAPVNDAPSFSAGPATVHGAAGQPFSQAWASAISAGPGEAYQAVHFELADNPANPGGLFSVEPSISPTGVLSFVPAAGGAGTATFEVVARDDGGLEDYGAQSGQPTPHDTSDPVTLAITVDENQPPVALDDPAVPACNAAPGWYGDSFPIPEDWGPMVLGLGCSPTSNDSDPDGTIVSWQIDTLPAHGTLDWGPDAPGVVTYTPDPDFSTAPGDWPSDSFTYHVVDDGGASSNVATYRLFIAPVNDAPSFTPGDATVHGVGGVAYDQPWATAISAGPNEADQTVHFEVTNVDDHGDPGPFAVAPSIGADGHLTFTLAAGRHGGAAVTVVAKDDGGLIDYSLPEVHPADTSAPVTFDIVSDNSAPVAGDEAVTVTEDQPSATVDVLANDTDVDADALTVSAKTNGTKGSVTIAAGGGSVTYKPNANAFGSDSFTYTASDGHGGLDSATVSVTITPVNDPPNAVNDGVPTPYAIYLRALPKSIPVLLNDTSAPDGPETLTIIAATQGSHGAVKITGGGTGLTYASSGSALGIDVFTYTVSDGHGKTDTASVQVKVIADTSRPKAGITSLTRTNLVDRNGSRISVAWTLSDTGSGVKSQLLQRRIDGGSWTTISLVSVSTRSYAFATGHGHTVTFRVRATDRYGNVGYFATSASIRT
jgi:hypothetical protein